ncbi:2-hydroxyacid dehydrogenase [Mesorhizobium sp. A623]
MLATKSKLLVLAKLPPDLTEALGACHDLVSAGDRADADQCTIAVTTAMRGLTAVDLEQFPGIGLVLSQGVGRDKLDLEAASARGVRVSITPDILTEDVADFAIGLMYAIARRIAEADRFVRAGHWLKVRIPVSTSLDRKRLGIIGMGKIGRSIARRGKGLGMTVGYTNRSRKDDLDYRYHDDPAALAADSDILILACSGGPETHHICDAGVLEALGPTGFVINIARGSVIDEAALLDALQADRIAGAALDVFASEPDLDPRFAALDNVVLTPHSASLTREVRTKLIGCMIKEIEAHEAGNPLSYAIV